MNYTQTLEFLFQSLPVFETQGATAYKPGLERITAFCRHIGNPQRNFFTIHVAGTNGKGSVAHIIASVLQQAGYRTGLFTSPHLQDFRERIRVDGEMIPKQKVVNFVDKHHDKMVELELSFFEMTAALAFDYFAQSDVEVAVIETGLGGRLDATNIIVPLVSVITNVGLDHTALLGDTLPKIAAEKAGIIKKSIPVVIGESDPRYNDVIEQAAAANKSKVIYAEQEFSCEPCPCGTDRQHFCMHRTRDNRNFEVDLDLGGNYQRRNMVTAAATATANCIPVLFLPGDTYADRQPDPVLQQMEQTVSLTTTTNDAFRAVCKYWDRVTRPEVLMTACINAMRVLTDPAETGAVCIALPQDVEGEAWDYPDYFFQKRVHHIDRIKPSERAIEEAVKAIAKAERPLMIFGGGVKYSEAEAVFQKFAEKYNRVNSSRSFSSRALVISLVRVSYLGMVMFFSALARFWVFLMLVARRMAAFSIMESWMDSSFTRSKAALASSRDSLVL